MNENKDYQTFWHAHAPKEIKDACYTAWSFGDKAELADELLSCVMYGQKRGTSSCYKLYELAGEPLPQAGECSLLLDSVHQPKAIVQTKHVEILPYQQVTELHAFLESEGDQSLAYWQSVHFPWFQEAAQMAGTTFAETDLVVYEYFELLYAEQHGREL